MDHPISDKPMASPRCDGGNIWYNMAEIRGCMSPTPMPPMLWNTTSDVRSQESPLRMELSVKSAMLERKSWRWPSILVSQPTIGMTTVCAMLGAVSTHWIWSKSARRLVISWGKTTFVTIMAVVNDTMPSRRLPVAIQRSRGLRRVVGSGMFRVRLYRGAAPCQARQGASNPSYDRL